MAGLILLASCGPKGESNPATDTVAQKVQFPNSDTSLAFGDRPVSPPPAPAPAPAPRPTPPPAPRPSPSPAPTPAPAPQPAPARPAPQLAVGTTFEATATREITSKVNKAGEQFTARIAEDI